MPTARASRRIPSSPEELWDLVRDPHHLPRWWPRVTRVEDVDARGFTEVMTTAKGKVVRADFTIERADKRGRSLVWSQQLDGTPFARVLSAAETEVSLTPAQGATEVTIEMRQTLTGFFPRFGGFLVRRAAAATIAEALDGLERIGA